MKLIKSRRGEEVTPFSTIVWTILIITYFIIMIVMSVYVFKTTDIDSKEIVYPYLSDESIMLEFNEDISEEPETLRFVRTPDKIEIDSWDYQPNLLKMTCPAKLEASPSSVKIVLDPAHGGPDTGHTISGIKESETVRLIAQSFTQRNRPSFENIQSTRDLDNDILEELTLEERAQYIPTSDMILTLHTGLYGNEEQFMKIFYIENDKALSSETIGCYILNRFAELDIDGISLIPLGKEHLSEEYALLDYDKIGLYIEIGNMRGLEAMHSNPLFSQPTQIADALAEGLLMSFEE